jgi:hypothetical protein
MKIVVFGSQRRVGLWEGDTVVDVNVRRLAYSPRIRIFAVACSVGQRIAE